MPLGGFVSCPQCGREVPGDARFCPYCGYRLSAPSEYMPLEGIEELESLVSTLKERYLPKEWKCVVDKKKKRLCFRLTFKTLLMLGLISDVRRPVATSMLITALEQALRHAEEDIGVRFVLDKAYSFLGHPTLYYRVFTRG